METEDIRVGGLLAHSTMVKVQMYDQIDLMVAFLIRIINLRQEGLMGIVSIVDKWAIEKTMSKQERTSKSGGVQPCELSNFRTNETALPSK